MLNKYFLGIFFTILFFANNKISLGANSGDYCPTGIDITVKDSAGVAQAGVANIDLFWQDNVAQCCNAPEGTMPATNATGQTSKPDKFKCGVGLSGPCKELIIRYKDPNLTGVQLYSIPWQSCNGITITYAAVGAGLIGSCVNPLKNIEAWLRDPGGKTCPTGGAPTDCEQPAVAKRATIAKGTDYALCCCPATNLIFGDAVDSAVGLIATEPEYLVKDILALTLGIAGGIAFLLLLMGAFQYITSSGSPDAVMGAKSTITAALTGLAVIVFSVLILGLLGVNVFGLPGFSWSGNVLTTPQ